MGRGLKIWFDWRQREREADSKIKKKESIVKTSMLLLLSVHLSINSFVSFLYFKFPSILLFYLLFYILALAYAVKITNTVVIIVINLSTTNTYEINLIRIESESSFKLWTIYLRSNFDYVGGQDGCVLGKESTEYEKIKYNSTTNN